MKSDKRELVNLLQLRSMSEQDIATVAQIERETNPAPWGETIFASCFGEGYHSWVITQENKPVAFVICLIAAGECHVLDVGVTTVWREQGLATRLIRQVIEEAVKQQAHIVWLEVRKSNLPAILLYRKLGFKEIGCRKNYYDAFQGREDALVMGLSL